MSARPLRVSNNAVTTCSELEQNGKVTLLSLCVCLVFRIQRVWVDEAETISIALCKTDRVKSEEVLHRL
jgi:hypothetical protein